MAAIAKSEVVERNADRLPWPDNHGPWGPRSSTPGDVTDDTGQISTGRCQLSTDVLRRLTGTRPGRRVDYDIRHFVCVTNTTMQQPLSMCCVIIIACYRHCANTE